MKSLRTTALVAMLALLAPLGINRAAATPAARATTAINGAAPHAGFGVFGNYTPVVGDFNGDGYDDIFWYAPGRNASSLWFGHANGQFTSVPETVMGDYTPVVGDLNGDGRSDIIWSSPDELPYPVWEGNTDGTFSHHSLSAPGTHFTPIVGDFNGDGHDDIFWDAADRGRDYIALGDGTGHFTLHHTTQFEGEHVTAVGDFSGDGRDDIFFESTDPSQANFFAIANSDGTFTAHAEDTPATAGIPLALDVNGDGRDDIIVYEPGTGADWIWYSGTSGLPQSRVFTTINGTYRPVVGDFTGSGHDDIFWYAPGSAPDHIWFDVAHDIPVPHSSEPIVRWEIDVPEQNILALTVDGARAYVETTDGKLRTYDRATGLPTWSASLSCVPAALVRQLDMLLVQCQHVEETYVYDAASGALIAQYGGDDVCVSDNPYYEVQWLAPPGGGVAHLTVIAARTGAVVWRTPTTASSTPMPCALSGERLMVARNGSPGGAEEYDVATKQLVFNRADHTTVWRFGPDGYIALCDTNDDLVGLGPANTVVWRTDASCPSYDSPFSFGLSTADLESGGDYDIVSGKLLGAFTSPPIASGGYDSTALPDDALVTFSAHTPLPGDCPGRGSEVMFLGPYGASPWLTGASAVRGLEFSHRAMAVELAGGECPPFRVAAWDERGVIRWVMPDSAAFDVNGPIGNDLATNGGVESSALIAVNTSDGTLELIDLP